MKTYRLSSDPYGLGIFNYDKKDEEIVFNKVLSVLNSNKNISMDESKEYPYCDMADGACKHWHFDVVYDLNYGIEIKADSKAALDYIENILNV